MIEETPMPSYLEAERGLLGLILWRKSAYDEIATLVDTEDFYRINHRQVFAAIKTLSDKQDAFDPITVNEYLQRKGVDVIDDTATFSYLMELQNHEINLDTFESVGVRAATYARLVAHYAELWRLAEVASKIDTLARGGEENALEQAEALIMAVRRKRVSQDFISVGDYYPTYLKRIDSIQEDNGKVRGIPTGFSGLDFITGGFQRGCLYVPAGRPGTGKSTFMLNIAYNAALKYKKRIAFFSCEMMLDDLMDGFVSLDTKINSMNLRNAHLTEQEHDLLVGDTMTRFEELGIYIKHTPGVSVDALKSMARRLVAKYDIDEIMVDYLQLMQAQVNGKRMTPRAEEVAEIARQLKALAGELNVPIVAPSQINRELERRAGYKVDGEALTYKMPMLSDMRESGEIEQSADWVGAICPSEEDNTRVKLKVLKHRHGESEGELDLLFVGSEKRFKPVVNSTVVPVS